MLTLMQGFEGNYLGASLRSGIPSAARGVRQVELEQVIFFFRLGHFLRCIPSVFSIL